MAYLAHRARKKSPRTAGPARMAVSRAQAHSFVLSICAATITVFVSNESYAAEASGNQSSLDQLLDDAMRMATHGAPPQLPWKKTCGYYIDKSSIKAQRECVISGADVVVHFKGSLSRPILSIDQGTTTGVQQDLHGTGVQIDDFAPHEWWPGGDSSIEEAKVSKTVSEMMAGKVIRYGQVNKRHEWSSIREQSLDGFRDAYRKVEDWFKAGEGSESGHRYTPDKP